MSHALPLSNLDRLDRPAGSIRRFAQGGAVPEEFPTLPRKKPTMMPMPMPPPFFGSWKMRRMPFQMGTQ